MNQIAYILVPVHNRRNITERFMQCIRAQTYKNYHLVLIDDGSHDGTVDMVREYIEHLTVIRGEGNWWWAGSLQKGYEWIRENKIGSHDLVVIMNDDTEFGPDFMEIGVSIMGANPGSLLGAQCYSKSSGVLLDGGVRADWQTMRFEQARDAKDINCLSTMGLFIGTHDFLDLGGFYPRILPHFASDYEFTMRAHRKGYRLVTDPSLKLHLREETTWNVEIGKEPFFAFVKNLFSKKSAYNPLVWTVFIALSCPMKWKLLNWYRLWMGTAFIVVSRIFKPVKLEGNTHFAGKEIKRT